MNIGNIKTPINYVGEELNNKLFIKREDFIPFSFGGNKARKAQLFFEEIEKGNFDCVVTYGSSSSNHCRIISNAARSMEIPCYIISPEEASVPTYNSQMMRLFGAEITTVPLNEVHETINKKLDDLKCSEKNPYFIPGGGHGNIGTQAFVNCYNEIKQYESINKVFFDYIFHASGTGTTQAGLICGQLISGVDRKIIGISIARKNPRGRQVVLDSVNEYMTYNQIYIAKEKIESATIFDDSYIGDGYGKNNYSKVIDDVLMKYGIPLDSIYTGKAYYGMLEFLKKNKIINKNILFIHTGGTPLFFDYLKRGTNV